MRFSWLLMALLCAGYFVALPDEGTAATKRTESLSLNFSKIEFDYKIDERPVGPPVQIADLHFGTATAQTGPLGGAGPSLPITSPSDVIAVDAFGVAHGASQDIFHAGAPGSFPPVSSYHLSMDFTVPGTMMRGESGVISVQHDPATSPDKSYWQASVEIAMPGATDHSFTFFVEANPDQPGLSLASVQTAQAPNFSPIASSFFDVFVELNYDGVTPIDPGKPVLWLTTTATPEPASAGVIALVGMALMRRRQ